MHIYGSYISLDDNFSPVLQTKNIMVSSYARTKEASQAKYISILNIIQGEVDPTQVKSFKAAHGSECHCIKFCHCLLYHYLPLVVWMTVHNYLVTLRLLEFSLRRRWFQLHLGSRYLEHKYMDLLVGHKNWHFCLSG